MDIKELIDELEEIIDEASTIPFSKKVSVDPDVIYGIINDLKDSIPEEIKQAKWVNQERDRILNEAKSQVESDKEKAKEEINRAYEEANRKFKVLVSEHSVTKEANERAEEIIANAKSTANTITTNSLAYVDQMLAKTSDEIKESLRVIEENRSQLKY